MSEKDEGKKEIARSELHEVFSKKMEHEHSRRDLIEIQLMDFLDNPTSEMQEKMLAEAERVLLLDMEVKDHDRPVILEGLKNLTQKYLVS